MVFSSVEFLYVFLPAFLVAYLLVPPYRNTILLIFSIAFYAFGEGYFVGVMLASIALNYVFGLVIASTSGGRRRLAVAGGVAANLALLIFYKYVGFLISDVLHLPHQDWAQGVHMPLGISFFTFQAISYIVDVHRGDARVERSLLRLGAYIAMFPQLVAGPIVRFSTVAIALRRRVIRTRHTYYALVFFSVGLAEKVLLADTAAGVADAVYGTPTEELSRLAAWLGNLAYSLQIFFDFSGYSAMAIGLGLALGFRFPRNFNFPYISGSITEFWRRWHLSLSTWFRDYVYIPLGGNRHGSATTYRNLFLVFLMTGVWHGAAWNFVVWGLYHGGFLIIERIGLGRLLARAPAVLRSAYALGAIYFGWILFRAESLGHAGRYMASLFVPNPDGVPARAFLGGESSFFLIVGVVCATPAAMSVARLFMAPPDLELINRRDPAWRYALGVAVALALLGAASIKVLAGSYSPFIYFRF